MKQTNHARKRVETGAEASAVHPGRAPQSVTAASSFDDAPDSRERRRADDPNVAVFDFDPGHADAAEDLAGELGAQFVESATRVEDLSDRINTIDDADEADVPMSIEDELGPEDLTDDLPPLSAATESTRFSLEDSEGDGLPDDDDDDFGDTSEDADDELDDGLDGDDLEED